MLTSTILWFAGQSRVVLAVTALSVGAALVTVTPAVAELLAATGSAVSEVTDAAVVITEPFGAAQLTGAVKVKLSTAPAASVVKVVVVALALTTTFCAGEPPLFVTVTV
jgi:hypothetical protein